MTLDKLLRRRDNVCNMKMVIGYLHEYGEMTEEDLQELLNIRQYGAIGVKEKPWLVP